MIIPHLFDPFMLDASVAPSKLNAAAADVDDECQCDDDDEDEDAATTTAIAAFTIAQ